MYIRDSFSFHVYIIHQHNLLIITSSSRKWSNQFCMWLVRGNGNHLNRIEQFLQKPKQNTDHILYSLNCNFKFFKLNLFQISHADILFSLVLLLHKDTPNNIEKTFLFLLSSWLLPHCSLSRKLEKCVIKKRKKSIIFYLLIAFKFTSLYEKFEYSMEMGDIQ